MHFLLQRSLNSQGQDVELADSEIVADVITIGSDADQDIQIEGEGVDTLHAELHPDKGGVRVKCAGGNRVSVENKSKKEVVIGVGESFAIDGWHFKVLQPPAGFDMAVLLEGGASETANIRIPSPTRGLPSLRVLSYLFFALTLVVVLLVPLFSDTFSGLLGTSPDRMWTSGPLHNAHQHPDAQDCKVCHQKAFQRVTDNACMSCHQDTHNHGSLNSDTVSKLEDVGKCAVCHREHNEPEMLIVHASSLCTDCHKDVAGQLEGGGSLHAVSAFSATEHPDFSATIHSFNKDRAEWSSVRAALDSTTVDTSNLKFDHKVHMDPGRVTDLRSGDALGCQSCHVLSEDEEHFEPITMDTSCRDCHVLSMAANGEERRLPHGQPDEVVAAIEEYYIARYSKIAAGMESKASTGSSRRLLPGKRGGGASTCNGPPLDCGIEAAKSSIDQQFRVSGCVTCHEIDENSAGNGASPWVVQPVKLVSDWYKHAKFDHRAHMNRPGDSDEGCITCHAANSSTQSTDVLIPDKQNCLACHNTSHSQSVNLECIDCHDFHTKLSDGHWSLPSSSMNQAMEKMSSGLE